MRLLALPVLALSLALPFGVAPASAAVEDPPPEVAAWFATQAQAAIDNMATNAKIAEGAGSALSFPPGSRPGTVVPVYRTSEDFAVSPEPRLSDFDVVLRWLAPVNNANNQPVGVIDVVYLDGSAEWGASDNAGYGELAAMVAESEGRDKLVDFGAQGLFAVTDTEAVGYDSTGHIASTNLLAIQARMRELMALPEGMVGGGPVGGPAPTESKASEWRWWLSTALAAAAAGAVLAAVLAARRRKERRWAHLRSL